MPCAEDPPRPRGLRRPILIMAFGGWNDAAESATTAVRYLGTSFRPRSSPRSTRRSSITSACPAPTSASSRARRRSARSRGRRPSSRSARASLARDLIVGVAIEPHLRWKTYCGMVLDLARRCEVTLVLTLGALLAEVPHTRPVRSREAPPIRSWRSVWAFARRSTKAPPGSSACSTRSAATRDSPRPASGPTSHYISGIENPKATLALVQRVAPLLGATVDVGDLEEAGKQFDVNLKRSSRRTRRSPTTSRSSSRATPPRSPAGGAGRTESDLPPASELVAEIEQFLRQQRPE